MPDWDGTVAGLFESFSDAFQPTFEEVLEGHEKTERWHERHGYPGSHWRGVQAEVLTSERVAEEI